jgi:membrane-bound serine protease (ClpP class)
MIVPRRSFTRSRPALFSIALTLVAIWLALTAAGQAGQRSAVVIALDGAIGPATAEYVVHNLQAAARDNAAVVVLRLDTPGGLDGAMRTIIRAVLASPVPVIGYVAPSGARAASAGTYILYASGLAAMAPGTNLGAATPVSLFGDTPLPGGPAPKTPPDAELTKVTNDSAAYIRGLAMLHGRNPDWAERAVREAVSLPYDAALKEHVIDLVAPTLPDLLREADGRTVLVAGQTVQLATAGLAIRDVAPDWRERLLATLTDPTIVYLLLLAGIAGIVFELTHPGIFLPGVLGTICLLLGGYGLNLLPIDYAGLSLAVFGIGLMIAEAFVPAFGAFVLGGGAAFLIGSLLMFRSPAFQPSRAAVIGATLASLGLFGIVVVSLIRSRRRPVVTGNAALIGTAGHTTRWSGTEGQVMVDGVFWNARAERPLDVGQAIRVVGRDGLNLLVEAT